MLKFIAILVVASFVAISAKPMTELKFGNTVIDTDHVDCKSSAAIIDECGMQQSYSFRLPEYSYPTNHSHLMSSCRRQSDAFKCLRAYAKCLSPLTKQVLTVMVQSRQKYNKKVCTEKPSEAANKLIEMSQCMYNDKALAERGGQVELSAITVSEAILNAKIESTQERLKYSCCSVAKSRRDFIEALFPQCKEHSQVATELVDSYLAETVGIICPDFEGKQKQDCEKLPKLPIAKPVSRQFVTPILNVIQTLA